MAKYSTYNAGVYARGLLGSTTDPEVTHEGGLGYTRTPKAELFLAAVTEMAEDKFYESAPERQARMVVNIQKVLTENDGWEWLCNLVTWLRKDAGMRSASIMIAAEAVAAANGLPQRGGLSARGLVAVACQRADEPAEFLGYWIQNKGRKLPAPVKRGVADAAVRLYSEWTALKYDGQSRTIRMADVIELTHPKPATSAQASLFKYLIDNRHNRDEFSLELLPKIELDKWLLSRPEDERKAAFDAGFTTEAGWSWERVAGWLPGGLTKEIWEGIIPSMGYMATLRNLRNFDQAGIRKPARDAVNAKLSDPEQVAKSLQFPYRFFTAYNNVDSVNYSASLEEATNLSVGNIPEFEGRTLVLIDVSGSMTWSSVGGEHSKALCSDVAALFGHAIAGRNAGRVDLVMFATTSAELPVKKGASLLRAVEDTKRQTNKCGGGTQTWQAIKKHYNGHDRVIVLTDEQSHDSGKNPGCFMHFFNLAGYKVSTAPRDSRTFAYGGFTDAMFSTMPLLERGTAQRWPWEQR